MIEKKLVCVKSFLSSSSLVIIIDVVAWLSHKIKSITQSCYISPVVAVASTTCSLEGMMMVVNESEIINNLKSTRRPRRKEQEENLSSKDF